jgi:transglutaminase-like putative cysteine protease
VFSERVTRHRGFLASLLVAVAACGALMIAPALDAHSPWISFETIATTFAPGKGESFNWSQTYGPLDWPRTGTTVLDVQAKFPSYWKAEDLDQFDGRGWESAPVGYYGEDPLAGVSSQSLALWGQSLTVTLRGVSTPEVIGAGTIAAQPSLATGAVQIGNAPGTYLSSPPLRPPDSYRVSVYTPEPSDAEMATAGAAYPFEVAPDLQMDVPVRAPADFPVGAQLPPQQVEFAPYGSAQPLIGFAGEDGTQALAVLQRSPYRRMYLLARRLEAGTGTPYDYLVAVMNFLAHGYTYFESTTATQYPLLTFLFGSKLGYCQQFAGTMALMLRMGGVPARVATGFATGSYDSTDRQYVVSDIDAHAWVEAFFPGYGWVKFDPTPTSAPARGGRVPATSLPTKGGLPQVAKPNPRQAARAGGAATSGRHHRRHGSSFPWPALMLAIVVALALAAIVAGLRRARRHRATEELLEELERAFARCGRPLQDGVTLTSLEHRFGEGGDAAGYVRALRNARYASGGERPTAAQRRAIRTELRAGLGVLGAIRAWLALPPGGLH